MKIYSSQEDAEQMFFYFHFISFQDLPSVSNNKITFFFTNA